MSKVYSLLSRPSPRSWCTHFWVQTGEQNSHLLSDTHERLFLVQSWKAVPPRKRVMGPQSLSCQIILTAALAAVSPLSLPSVRCHRNEKWKNQYSATAEGSVRGSENKGQLWELLQLLSALLLGQLGVCRAACCLMSQHVPKSKDMKGKLSTWFIHSIL